MTEKARRATVGIAGAAITLALALRVAACGAGHQKRGDGPPRRPTAALTVRSAPRSLTAGEGAEHPGARRPGVPPAVMVRARAALAVYRSRERHTRRDVALPALRPLILAPAGPRRWTAIAIARRGELYLVLDLEQTNGGALVAGIR